MKNLIKTLKVIPAVIGLALGANAYAQEAANIDDSFFNRTGDGILVSNYEFTLDRNAETSVDSLLKGGNVTNIYAIDPVEGLNEIISYVKNNPRANAYISKEQRGILTDRYKSFINKIKKEERSSNYKKSLENLSNAVKDGIIEPSELNEVENETYMIIKKGTSKEKMLNGFVSEPYGVYAIVKLNGTANEEPEQQIPNTEVRSLPPYLAKDKPSIPKLEELTPSKPEEKSKQSLPSTEVINMSIAEPSKDMALEFLVQGESNFSFNTFGASTGLRYGDGKAGFGALAGISFGGDKNTTSYSAPLSAGRNAYGTTNNTNNISVEGLLEVQLGPIIAGAGIDYSSWTENILEQIKDKSGNVLKSNTNSKQNGQASAKGYIGFEIGAENIKARLIAGYGQKGFYFGAGTAIRLNQPKKGK